MNTVPLEILSRIFQCIPHKDDTDARSIVTLTHVCQYWRELIISTPQNWTLVSNRSEGLATISLQRAKAAPLELWLRAVQVRGRYGSPKLTSPYIQNIKTLHFTGFKSIEELIRALPNFPQSAPELRSLTLLRLGGPWWDDCSVDPFESLTLSLTHLSLADVHLYPSLLRLRDLTELTLCDRCHPSNLHLDTLLDFLEENRSLKSATLEILFMDPSLLSTRSREATIANQLQYLRIYVADASGAKALIRNIALRRGAHLEIVCGRNAGLSDILSGIPTAQFSNLSSPIFMEYVHGRSVRLLGSNGSFSFLWSCDEPFVGFHLLPLASIREFRFLQPESKPSPLLGAPISSLFPTAEAFAFAGGTQMSDLLSTLFSNPSSPPSLKTLAFLDCDLSEGFMEELTRFASNRKNTTSAWLFRVLIVDSKGNLPSTASIEALGKHVSIVNVCVDKELPTDLT